MANLGDLFDVQSAVQNVWSDAVRLQRGLNTSICGLSKFRPDYHDRSTQIRSKYIYPKAFALSLAKRMGNVDISLCARGSIGYISGALTMIKSVACNCHSHRLIILNSLHLQMFLINVAFWQPASASALCQQH